MRRKPNEHPKNKFDIGVDDFETVSIQEHAEIPRTSELGKTIFDKIGRPTHFLAIKNLKASKAGLAWEGLYQYMLVNGVELNVCSPDISAYELYRFATEELFNFEIEDSSSSDVIHSFIYDDFYPDHKYDNSRAAVDDCISCIFSKRSYEWMHFFRDENLTLNHYTGLSKEDFKIRVQAFQGLFRSFSVLNIRLLKVTLNDKECRVSGTYSVKAQTLAKQEILEGDWLVQFGFNKNLGFWEIIDVNIKRLAL